MEVYMSINHGLPAGFNPDNYDVIVVGAVYAGAVVARRTQKIPIQRQSLSAETITALVTLTIAR